LRKLKAIPASETKERNKKTATVFADNAVVVGCSISELKPAIVHTKRMRVAGPQRTRGRR
jgi:hypothetical protein